MTSSNIKTVSQLTDTEIDRIAELLVNREIYCCMTSEIENILAMAYESTKAIFSWNMIEVEKNTAEFEDLSGETLQLTEEQSSELYHQYGDLEGHLYSEEKIEEAEKVGEKLRELEDLEFEEKEVLEWWACSEFLIGKLKDAGLTTLGGKFWGRCQCGQSKAFDKDIQQIALECFSDTVLNGELAFTAEQLNILL